MSATVPTSRGSHLGSDRIGSSLENTHMAQLAQALTKRGDWTEDDNADLSRSFRFRKHRRYTSSRCHVAIGPVRVTPRKAKAMFRNLNQIKFNSSTYENLYAMVEVKTGKIVNKAFMTTYQSHRRNNLIRDQGYQWKSIAYNGESARLYGRK